MFQHKSSALLLVAGVISSVDLSVQAANALHYPTRGLYRLLDLGGRKIVEQVGNLFCFVLYEMVTFDYGVVIFCTILMLCFTLVKLVCCWCVGIISMGPWSLKSKVGTRGVLFLYCQRI